MDDFEGGNKLGSKEKYLFKNLRHGCWCHHMAKVIFF